MPLYEYRCTDCRTTFEKLRPMSKADAPAICGYCGSADTSRAISMFSAISRSSSGGGITHAISGTGASCASCAATSCATCSH
jgi:putative FmdB family regulatory protein